VHIRAYLELLQMREQQLAEALVALAEDHADAPDLAATSRRLARWSGQHAQALQVFVGRYPPGEEPDLAAAVPPLAPARFSGNYGLVHDLQIVWLLVQDVQARWEVLRQVSWALRDRELFAACEELGAEARRQAAWVRARLAEAAVQGIIAAP